MTFKLFIISILISLSASSCGVFHQNRDEYTVKVGKTFKIYYQGNSCCGRCWNTQELENITLIKSKVIKRGKKPGSSTYYFNKFRATQVGTDSLKTQYYAMSRGCDLDSGNFELYLIYVTE